MLDIITISSLVSVFSIKLLGKLGVTEWLQVHGTKSIHDLASCVFCMSFWLNTFTLTIAGFYYQDLWMVLLAVPATTISCTLLALEQ